MVAQGNPKGDTARAGRYGLIGDAGDAQPPRAWCCKCLAGCPVVTLVLLLAFVGISELTAKPVTDEPSLFLDGWTQAPVPRRLIEDNATEMLYAIDVEGQGITVDGDHAILALNRQITGEFLRLAHVDGVSEYGLSKQMWIYNPVSVFGDTVRYGVMEKLHTMSHNGTWRTTNIDKVAALKKNRWSLTTWFAGLSNVRFVRTFLLHVFLSLAETGVPGLFFDRNLTKEIDAFAATVEVPSAMRARLHELRQNITAQSVGLAKLQDQPKYELSADNCLHFAEHPDVTISFDEVRVPLDTLLVAHRGQTTFAPVYHFSMASGAAIFSYDKGAGALNVYFVASSQLIIPDLGNIAESPPTQYVGPPSFNGTKYSGPDMRNPKVAFRSWMFWFIYFTYNAIPIDYDFLHGDVETACPQSDWEKYNQQYRNVDMKYFVKHPPTPLEALNLALLFSSSVACGMEYLGAGHDAKSASLEVDASHGYDYIEAQVWAHAILETVANKTMSVIGNKEWNCLYLSKGAPSSWNRSDRCAKALG